MLSEFLVLIGHSIVDFNKENANAHIFLNSKTIFLIIDNSNECKIINIRLMLGMVEALVLNIT